MGAAQGESEEVVEKKRVVEAVNLSHFAAICKRQRWNSRDCWYVPKGPSWAREYGIRQVCGVVEPERLYGNFTDAEKARMAAPCEGGK